MMSLLEIEILPKKFPDECYHESTNGSSATLFPPELFQVGDASSVKVARY
jgi:hypothetical protein